MRKSGFIKLMVLATACSFLVGSYFCYDIPGTLKTQIMKDFGISQTKENLLYTVYSFPNFVLPLIGGILLDKIGIRVCLILFTTILTLG